MRKNPSVVQCKLELESTVASLRHILISPGVRRGLSQPVEEKQGGKLGATAVWPGPGRVLHKRVLRDFDSTHRLVERQSDSIV